MPIITARNPWGWQDQFGFSQAIEVRDGAHVVFCAGQTSVDENGDLVHPGDMVRQLAQALDNLETVLAKAGLGLENVVRLNYYTTDVDALMDAFGALGERIAKLGRPPASTLLGVQRLAHPDMLIEVEATAVA